jgi:hypothetical protein
MHTPYGVLPDFMPSWIGKRALRHSSIERLPIATNGFIYPRHGPYIRTCLRQFVKPRRLARLNTLLSYFPAIEYNFILLCHVLWPYLTSHPIPLFTVSLFFRCNHSCRVLFACNQSLHIYSHFYIRLTLSYSAHLPQMVAKFT